VSAAVATVAFARRPDTRPLLGAIAVTVALAGIGVVSSAVAAPADEPKVTTAATFASDAERLAAENRGSRDHNRAAPTPGARSSSAGSSKAGSSSAGSSKAGSSKANAQSAPSQQKPAASPSPTKPSPVAGLDQAAMDNATAIVDAGREMNLPRRAFVVAIATALQESQLRNLANPGVPQSMNLPNEGTGRDFDSVGLFQQRASMGWGRVDQLMNPKESARSFYSRLATIGGWEQLSITVAAQRVQGSAFPDAYAKHQSRAEEIVNAILK
jgi:hypothetical protein